MQYLYTAVFTPFEDGTGYEARIPDIPHCVTSGRDLPDALGMIADAASLMLVDMEDAKAPIPVAARPASRRGLRGCGTGKAGVLTPRFTSFTLEATPPQRFQAPEGGVTSLVCLDTDRYRMGATGREARMIEQPGH